MRRTIALVAIAAVACTETHTTGTTDEAPGASVREARGAPSAAKVKSVTVNPSSATLAVGATVQLIATSKPPGASFTWSSTNNSVATVSQSGVVTGVSAGAATISATAGGKTGSSAITVTASPPPGNVTLLAAGDISDCNNNNDELTAQILDGIPDATVALLGDNVYESGTAAEFTNCYQPTWGRHKARTMPSAGNHEYQTPGATGYYGYFGAAAGDPAKGYYSYDLGAWHIVVLNSNIARDAASAQIAWLRSDLTANSRTCTLAYWHHPRFSSGPHGNNTTMQSFWDVLYEFNADVILNGHDHDYERFAPQNPSAVADAARGIRQFVVGTGGRSHYALTSLKANSQVFDGTTFGVIRLTLSATSYTWQFVPVQGGTFTDSGSGSCH